ncbi:MAG: radical SAM protein [Acidobacteriota bacterium]|jgi:MoaA/NifB/PqqE/SkfB family radical SAM enzyme
MRKVPLGESLRIIARGSANWFSQRPIVVSFEVTDSCTCFCKHCDHGGERDDSRNMKPADYRKYMQELGPCVVQISGGEPLLRPDLFEVVRNIKSDSGLPYTILVSNWSLMTEEKYLQLREAGVDEFCVSLDFPDERHDDFRGLPGLYKHLSEIVPGIAALGYDDIVMNNCITAWNVSEINAIADKVAEWGVNLNYSAYSPRRTGCRDYFITTSEQRATLNRELDRIKERMDKSHWITNNKSTLDATVQYFTQGGAPNCKAGLRWLVVTSDGSLQPCSMQFKKYGLHEQARMVKEFTENNSCDQCYVSIRSWLDKTFPQLVRENVSEFFSFKPR